METKEKHKQKLLLVLPLLVWPFLALAFYAMGGGTGDQSQQVAHFEQGLNTNLPDAAFKKNSPTDKLSLYELAERDTASSKNLVEDPFQEEVPADRLNMISVSERTDPNEQRINEKLAQINREINRPQEVADNPSSVGSNSAADNSISNDVERLEKLMASMQEEKTEDPEMEQLSEMIDKIITIQNPSLSIPESPVSVAGKADSLFRTIPAEIVNDQKVVQGATIKLRLLDTITLNGQTIPKDHFVFGTGRITNQRLMLDIRNIRLGTSIIPVNLSVYSLDGMQGIYAPEAMLNDAVSMGSDNALRNVDLIGLDRTLTAQVADAGLDAAKRMLSKKVKRVKVKLKAGQPILLRNNELINR